MGVAVIWRRRAGDRDPPDIEFQFPPTAIAIRMRRRCCTRRSTIASISSDAVGRSCMPWTARRTLPSRSATDLLHAVDREARTMCGARRAARIGLMPALASASNRSNRSTSRLCPPLRPVSRFSWHLAPRTEAKSWRLLTAGWRCDHLSLPSLRSRSSPPCDPLDSLDTSPGTVPILSGSRI
jgi:hypothetical protein